MYPKDIVLITSGQPATNPRLVREADLFTANGHHVTVLYCYWNKWATLADQELFSSRKWQRILVAGAPGKASISYYKNKFFHHLLKWCNRLQITGRLKTYAFSRATPPLIQAARRIPADLYIAHNLAALPAAVSAAKRHHASAGFDAEDYHRQETAASPDNQESRRKVMIEDIYIPQLDHFTTSSSGIAELYYQHYHRRPLVIRNLLPKVEIPHTTETIAPSASMASMASMAKIALMDVPRTIKLFWFSQTIGPNRGLELIMEALRYIAPGQYELHLLGEPKLDYVRQLHGLASLNNIPWSNLHLHKPVGPEELTKLCTSFDVGLASEPGFCLNNDIALSNKLFTYIQAGLAVLLSDTTAQRSFFDQHPTIGKCYQKDDAVHLAQAIQYYVDHEQVLADTKNSNYQMGQRALNWEMESQTLMQSIELILS